MQCGKLICFDLVTRMREIISSFIITRKKTHKNTGHVVHSRRVVSAAPKRTKSAIMRRRWWDDNLFCVSARAPPARCLVFSREMRSSQPAYKRIVLDDKSAEVTLNSHCAPPRIKKQQRRRSWREHKKTRPPFRRRPHRNKKTPRGVA